MMTSAWLPPPFVMLMPTAKTLSAPTFVPVKWVFLVTGKRVQVGVCNKTKYYAIV